MRHRSFAPAPAAVLRAALGLAFAFTFALTWASRAGAARLAPGEPVLSAAESARSVVVGVVAGSRRLDGGAYVAHLRVEDVLRGVAPAARQPVAWEQPPSRREPRLVNGQRILVALDPLPSVSSWQQRVAAADALFIAGGGHAYLRDPGATELAHLRAYLRLEATQRAANAGILHLARLVADAQPILALAALRRIGEIPAQPGPRAVAALAQVAGDDGADREVRIATISLLGKRRLRAARVTLDELAKPPSDLEPEALDAIAAIDGELAPSTVERLLAHADSRWRLVGARHAGDAMAERYLVRLATADPAAAVRGAAVASLAATHTTWGLAAALDVLADPSGEVRGAAAQAIARLGAPALPALLAEIDAGTGSAPGAVATLAAMGPAGNPSLVAVARSHPNEQMRGLALLALGRVRDEHSP